MKDESKLSEIDANFIISSFKNKERRNNPSSIPKALLPEREIESGIENAVNKATTTDEAITDTSPTQPIIDDNDIKSDTGIITDDDRVPTDTTKRISSRQRKAAFEEYRALFLSTPKIKHRKPVFISEKLREQLDEIARKLGDKGMSASGLIENLVIHHLMNYMEDIECWRKL